MASLNLLENSRVPALRAEISARRFSLRAVVPLLLPVACGCIWLVYTGGRSPWIELNLPGGIHGSNPASGYTSLYNGDFYHKENFYALQHIDLIKGNYDSFRDRIGFCDRRMFYGVTGNILTLVFSSYAALRLINLAMFVLCARLVRRMTEELFGEPAKGHFAAALFVFSTMATVHVGDVSPHFVAFAYYYGWAILMVRLAKRTEPLSWRENLGHASILGLWSLTYTSFAYGLAIYLIVVAKRREWRYCALPTIVCFAMPLLQLLVVRALGFGYSTDVEKLLMTRGLSMHWQNFHSGPLSYSLFLLVEFVNYLINDNPLNVLVGVAALVALQHPAKWVLWLIYLIPIAMVFAFLGTTTARGYVVAGNTIVLFPLAAHGFIETAHWLNNRVGKIGLCAVIGSALLIQILWGQGSLAGWHFPTGSYAMGIFKHLLIAEPTNFVRMTGNSDDKPALHGGRESAAVSLGLPQDFGKQPIVAARWRNPFANFGAALRTFTSGFFVALPVLICTGGLLFSNWTRRWSRPCAAALMVLVPASLLFGAAEGVEQTAYLKYEDRIEVREGESLSIRVPVSPDFFELLRDARSSNAIAQIHLHYHGNNSKVAKPAEMQMLNQSTTENRLVIPTASLVEHLEANGGTIDCRVTPVPGSGGIFCHSWQKPRVGEGRVAEIVSADGSRRTVDWFPSLEIRVLRGEQNYPTKSLISRWDSAIPVGYELVGF